jgi:branched-chain amino acid transport system permease protein
MEKVKRMFKAILDRQLPQLIVIFAAPAAMYFTRAVTVTFILFLVSLLLLYLNKMKNSYKLIIAVVDLLAVMPLAGLANSYALDVITQIGIYAVLAIGLNVVVGFAGLLDLGYVGFYAAGAYVYAFFATVQANNVIPESVMKFPISGNWFWLFLPICMLVAAGVGVLLGLPVLRLKGDYLAIVTLGFAEIIRIILNNADKPINLTNGPKGLTPIQPPAFFGIVLNQSIHFYFIVLGILLMVILATKRIYNSRIGRAWTAIREDELAARAMGIPLVKMKLMAFAMGAGFAGMMGCVFAAKQTFIDPSSFGFMESIGILSMVIMGGMGNISGVIIGALAVVVLQLQLLKELSSYLRDLTVAGVLNIPASLDPAKYERLVFGLILILMCIFRPKGFLPAKRSLVFIRKLLGMNGSKEEKALNTTNTTE